MVLLTSGCQSVTAPASYLCLITHAHCHSHLPFQLKHREPNEINLYWMSMFNKALLFLMDSDNMISLHTTSQGSNYSSSVWCCRLYIYHFLFIWCTCPAMHFSQLMTRATSKIIFRVQIMTLIECHTQDTICVTSICLNAHKNIHLNTK